MLITTLLTMVGFALGQLRTNITLRTQFTYSDTDPSWSKISSGEEFWAVIANSETDRIWATKKEKFGEGNTKKGFKISYFEASTG